MCGFEQCESLNINEYINYNENLKEKSRSYSAAAPTNVMLAIWEGENGGRISWGRVLTLASCYYFMFSA
jgi:hypothetical protein